MAKFKVEAHGFSEGDIHGHTEGYLYANTEGSALLSVDDLLKVLSPAAQKLRDYYKQAILTRFRKITGSLAESIDIDDGAITSKGEAFIHVGPTGRHKTGKFTRKSRAGDPSKKYAKHKRKVSTKAITNQELAYLLEFGTPRIAATHWMEETNDKVMDEIQDMVDAGFTELLREKGLI